MKEKHEDCNQSNTEKSTDDAYYFTGQSHYCKDCEIEFTPDGYEDSRESSLGLQTSSMRLNYETDEDYEERMADLDNL